MRRLSRILIVLAVAASALVLAALVVRPQTGPLTLVSTFEVHILAVATVAALLGLPGSLGGGKGRARMRLLVLGVFVLAFVRLGDELWSPTPEAAPGDGSTTELSVLSWNLEMMSKPPADAAAGVASIDADIVALQELTPEFAAAIEADTVLRARYPYRILDPRPGPDGLGILARRPLIVRDAKDPGRILRAGLLLTDGRTLEVLDVHPARPAYQLAGPVPVSLDTRRRDADVERIADLVARLDEPAAALVVGDLNGTSSEAGLRILDDGLIDAHAAVGTGPGFTWRPDQLEILGIGILRIDHVLTGSGLMPVASTVDCSLAGDHCRLLVTLRVGTTGP